VGLTGSESGAVVRDSSGFAGATSCASDIEIHAAIKDIMRKNIARWESEGDEPLRVGISDWLLIERE
jgi:hypothetical protein